MNQSAKGRLLPFFAAALSQTMFVAMTAEKAYYTAREGLLAALCTGLIVWAGLGLLRFVEGNALLRRGRGVGPCICRGVLAVALLIAAIQTLYELAVIYARQYENGVFWVLLLAVALLTLTPAMGALDRVSCAILALAGLAAVLLVIGLGSQMQIRSLDVSPIRFSGVWAAAGQLLCILPEYLALPVTAQNQRRWWLLPMGIALCQAGTLLASELVFGFSMDSGRYPAGEALRAWGLGLFSRMDALWVGLWLVLAMLRLLLIRSIILQVWPQTQGKQVRHEA